MRSQVQSLSPVRENFLTIETMQTCNENPWELMSALPLSPGKGQITTLGVCGKGILTKVQVGTDDLWGPF